MKTMLHNNERVVYIEYQNGIPHSVITASEKGDMTVYDFDFYYGDKKDIRYYKSGGGGHMTQIQAPTYIDGCTTASYWVADDAGFNGEPKNIKRLSRPLPVKMNYGSSINPFKNAIETSWYIRCDRCGQNMIEECRQHQYWDDQAGVVRYTDTNESAE